LKGNQMNPREQFNRTKCACEDCVNICRMPAYLIPGDLERITDFLSMELGCVLHPRDVAVNFFAASPGALVAKMHNGNMVQFRIPTIVPRTSEDGTCVFQSPDGKCTIHDVAPYGCGWFDFHMDRKTADERSHTGLTKIMEDEIEGSGTYLKHWEALHAAGHRTATPDEKRKALLT
jgi:Fe-S-cluster containining protein